MTYTDDRKWSDKYIPAIKQIIGPMLLEESSFEIDTQQATDLIVLKARDLNFACRIRRPGYADKYPWEITLRSGRPSGVKTELAKIVDGWGDYAFYGHTDGTGGFNRYFVIDLNSFRADLIRKPKKLVYETKGNYDGSSTFTAFDVRSFSPNVIAKSSHEVPFQVAA